MINTGLFEQYNATVEPPFLRIIKLDMGTYWYKVFKLVVLHLRSGHWGNKKFKKWGNIFVGPNTLKTHETKKIQI